MQALLTAGETDGKENLFGKMQRAEKGMERTNTLN